MKCNVLIPFVRSTPENGFETFTHGDVVEIEAAEAKRMAEAGAVEIIGADKPVVETMEQKPEAPIEKAVKPSKKGA